MSSDEGATFLLGAALSGLLVLAVCSVAHKGSMNAWEKQCIEHGAAQYNPTTGNFEWKEKVDNGSK